MPKRVSALLFALMLLVGGTARAGDIPESIMGGRHLAMFIGQITAIGSDTMTIEPLTVMMGEASGGAITVKPFESYSLVPHHPKKGDYLVALLLDERTIDESWVFECTGSDYKTLEIVGCDYDMVERYVKYINEGAYFEAQQRLDQGKPTEAVPPSPVPTAAGQAAEATPSLSSIDRADEVQTASGGAANPERDNNMFVLTIIVAVLACGAGLAMLCSEARKKKAKKQPDAQEDRAVRN